jgi:hypothetical protein
LALVSEPPTAIPQRSILCPACGYDLRASTDDRCSECGLVIDRESLLRSGIPWASSKQIGHIRAFWKTVWFMTVDAKVLRQEAVKPQSVRDAAAFRRWVTMFVVASVGIVAAMFVQKGGLEESIARPKSVFALAPTFAGWAQDMVVPWSAGMTLGPAIYGYGALAAICIVRAPAAIFRTPDMAAEQAVAARALGIYVSAPLVWLLPATATLAAMVSLGVDEANLGLIAILTVMWWLFALAAVGFTIHRTGQWRARVIHGGYPTGFAAMGELLLRWAIGICACIFVVPWCIGLLWIIVDSFRA